MDADGSSGLATANDPIVVTGTNQLPVIPSSGQTLIIDNNVITLTKTASSETRNTIRVLGTQNIASADVVAHGSTIILGESENINTTITLQTSKPKGILRYLEVPSGTFRYLKVYTDFVNEITMICRRPGGWRNRKP